MKLGDRVEMKVPWEYHPYGGSMRRGTVVQIRPAKIARLQVNGIAVWDPETVRVELDIMPGEWINADDTTRVLSLLELIAEAAK